MPKANERRQRAQPWKQIYGRDRKYTERKDRADQREVERLVRTDKQQLTLTLERGGNPTGKEAKRLRARIKAG
jgi:hypothetical protein